MFSFVYIRTGKIIYTMILHASLNLVTSSITVELLTELINRMGPDLMNGEMDPGKNYDAVLKSILPIMLILVLWLLILVGIQITGFILVIVKRKQFKLMQIVGELPRKVLLNKMTHNVTMWVFFTLALLLFVNTYLPDILAFVFH